MPIYTYSPTTFNLGTPRDLYLLLNDCLRTLHINNIICFTRPGQTHLKTLADHVCVYPSDVYVRTDPPYNDPQDNHLPPDTYYFMNNALPAELSVAVSHHRRQPDSAPTNAARSLLDTARFQVTFHYAAHAETLIGLLDQLPAGSNVLILHDPIHDDLLYDLLNVYHRSIAPLPTLRL